MHFCSFPCLLHALSISYSFIFLSEPYMVKCASHKAPNCESFSSHLLPFCLRSSYFPLHLIFENLIPCSTIQNHKELIFFNFAHVCQQFSYIYCIVLTITNLSLLLHRASCRFTNYHTTNKCTNCMSFILNHFLKHFHCSYMFR